MTKNKFVQKLTKKLKIGLIFPYLLVLFGAAGLVASTTINIEKTNLLQHPKTELFCDLNPVYSCGNVITSKQSKTFGVSNELYGMALFTAILTVGVMVLAGAKPKQWLWKLFMLGMIGFMVFVLYLWTQSVYVIGFLCILCTTVWVSGWTITAALYSWLYDQKLFTKVPNYLVQPLAWLRKYSVGVWLGLIVTLVVFTMKHFWYYYGRHLWFS